MEFQTFPVPCPILQVLFCDRLPMWCRVVGEPDIPSLVIFHHTSSPIEIASFDKSIWTMAEKDNSSTVEEFAQDLCATVAQACKSSYVLVGLSFSLRSTGGGMKATVFAPHGNVPPETLIAASNLLHKL